MRDRTYYSRLTTDELRRALAAAEDRNTRAETMEEALQDMFTIDEISAVLDERDRAQAA